MRTGHSSSLVPSVERGEDVSEDGGVLAPGRRHCNTLAGPEHAALCDGLVDLGLEGMVEAVPADL